MNRIPIFKEEIENGFVELPEDYRSEHIRTFLQKSSGESTRVMVLDGEGIGDAMVHRKNSSKILLELIPGSFTKTPSTGIEMMVALSRPPTMKKVLEHGSSMGVEKFHLVLTSGCEKSYLSSRVLRKEELVKRMVLGLSQSNIYHRIPQVKFYGSLKEFLEQDFPSEKPRILASLEKDRNFNNSLTMKNGYLGAIGPERGFQEGEEKMFIQAGFQRMRLHPATLRVEIAFFSLLAQAEYIKAEL